MGKTEWGEFESSEHGFIYRNEIKDMFDLKEWNYYQSKNKIKYLN